MEKRLGSFKRVSLYRLNLLAPIIKVVEVFNGHLITIWIVLEMESRKQDNLLSCSRYSVELITEIIRLPTSRHFTSDSITTILVANPDNVYLLLIVYTHIPEH